MFFLNDFSHNLTKISASCMKLTVVHVKGCVTMWLSQKNAQL